ncbi:hypothetical protein HanLR1_Chr01g0020931 [Helianthus annuus]|nr:hypothetical protein HanLR1_Chr01g0020931 [Helianthus annuus]
MPPSKATIGGNSPNPRTKNVKLRITARINVRPVWRKDLFGPIPKIKPVETINHISDFVPKTFETSNEKPTSEESIPTVPEAPTPRMIPMDPNDPYFLTPSLGITNLDYTSPDPIRDPYYSLTIESLDSTFAKVPNMEDFDYPPKPSVSVPHTVNQGENFQKQNEEETPFVVFHFSSSPYKDIFISLVPAWTSLFV